MTWLAGVDAPSEADLRTCISCGLCLPACPTYRLTGRESASPRGRIGAMRAVAWDGAPVDETFRGFMDFCLQCRACETACPAAVPFGRMMEGARAQVEAGAPRGRGERFLRWLGLEVVLPRRALLLLVTLAAWLAQRLRLGQPRSLKLLPPLSLRQVLSPVQPEGPEEASPAALFLGCVQDAWFRPVNRATARALGRRGSRVTVPPGQTCCGALAAHYGRLELARDLARRNVAALAPTEGPIVVASAGCGAAMKEWGHLLEGEASAVAVSQRVRDVTEMLADHQALAPPQAFPPARVAVHDPCHLVHAQKVSEQPRIALRRLPGVDLVDVPDSTVCCGAAGLYNLLQPEAASELGRRKAAAIASVHPDVVAVANPGCAMQIGRHLREAGHAGIRVAHPVELVEEAGV